MVNVENIDAATPSIAKPTRNYLRELEKLTKRAKASPDISDIEMRLGLSMLTGGKFDRAMYEPFDWAASLELLGPFLAFIYQRMHAEVRMLDTVDLPQM